MRIIELFAGIGACSKALERIGIDIEIVDAVEIDKYAIKSFNAIHGTNFEAQDIKKWDKDYKEIDIITHGSPCQDFSIAGKQAGGDAGSGTRSSLMYETLRIVSKIKPKYVLWENVKNILSKKHIHNFENYINAMKELGYTSYYQVLNAKDYGIPQNRERVFTISILDSEEKYKFPDKQINENEIDRICGLYGQATRWGIYNKEGISPTLTAAMGIGGGHVPMIETFKFPKKQKLNTRVQDILERQVNQKYILTDKNKKTYKRKFGSKGKEIDIKGICPTLTAAMGSGGGNVPFFSFPTKQNLKLRLKDILENKVDEKYYLNDKQIERIHTTSYNVGKTRIQEKDWCDTLCARDWKDPKCVKIGGIFDTEKVKHQSGSIYDKNGISPTLSTMEGGWSQPSIVEKTCSQQKNDKFFNKIGFISKKINSYLIRSANKRGYEEAYNGDSVNLSYPKSKTRRGRVGKQVSQTLQCDNNIGVVVNETICLNSKGGRKGIDGLQPSRKDRVYDSKGIAATISTSDFYNPSYKDNLRIRKLTPKECWRLMGFDDSDFEKAKSVPTSDTQLYKQAGNSIVVNVVEKIFLNLFKS